MDHKNVTLQALGMNEEQDLLAEDARFAYLASNVHRDPEGFWKPAGGTVQVGAWAAGTGAILSMLWFEPRPGIRYLVYEQSSGPGESELRYVVFPNGASSTIATRRRLRGGRFVVHGRWLYHLNGFEAPIRWDGYRVEPVGWVGPASMPQALGGTGSPDPYDAAGVTTWPTTWSGGVIQSQRGVGEDPLSANAPWRYGYAGVRVNDQGQQSPRSPIAWVTGENTTAASLKKLIRLHFDAGPDNAAGLIVLRTRNMAGVSGTDVLQAAPLYVHSRWSTGAEVDLWDHAPDGELGELWSDDAVGPVPIGASDLAIWHGRGWYAVGGDVMFSSPGFVEQVPALNVLPVSSNGRIVALRAIPRGLLVWTSTATYMVKWDGSTYRAHLVSSRHGLAARSSVVQVSNFGLAWLSPEGPVVLVGSLDDDQGTAVQRIPGIRRTWRRAAPVDLEAAWVVHDPELQEVWWHIPQGGQREPTLGLVYHLDGGGWSVRQDHWPFSAATYYAGRVWLGSHDDSTNDNTGIHLLTPGSLYRLTEDVAGTYVTGHLGGPERVSASQLLLRVLGQGAVSGLTVEWRGDRKDTFTDQRESGTRSALQPEEDRPQWQVSTWSAAAIWTDYEPVVVPVSLYRANAFEHQFRLRGARFRLAAWSLGMDPRGGAANVQRLVR